MTPLTTDFSVLKETVARIGIPPSERARLIVEQLDDGIMVESKTEYISAPSGFFDLLPNGDIVRLILHLGAYHGVTKDGRELYDSERWHKFHLTPCGSVKGAPPSRKLRYVKTRRFDGKFRYRVHNGFGEEVQPQLTVQGRALKLCGSCRNKIIDRMGFEDFVNEFNLQEFVNGYASVAMRFNSDPIRYDGDMIDYFKWDDWNEIARYVKARSGWICAGCRLNCSYRTHRKFLQAHYEKGVVGGALANVTPLCIGCHSREPGSNHRRLLRLPLFQEFTAAFPGAV